MPLWVSVSPSVGVGSRTDGHRRGFAIVLEDWRDVRPRGAVAVRHVKLHAAWRRRARAAPLPVHREARSGIDRQLPKRDSRVKAGSPALRRQPAAALMNAVARFRPPLLRAVVSTQRSPSRSASLFSQVECPAAGRTGTAAAGCELSQLREEQLPFPGENTLPFPGVRDHASAHQHRSRAGGHRHDR